MVGEGEHGNPQFVAVVRAEMNRQGLGARTLARRIVGPDAGVNELDNMRRSLRKWLLPKHSPSAANRDKVADALGIDRELLAEPDPAEDERFAMFMQQAYRKWMRDAHHAGSQVRETVNA